jgi:membrane protein
MADIDLGPAESGTDATSESVLQAWGRAIWAVLHDATAGLVRHDGVMVASAIAFSLVFAVFPFAIFVVALGAKLGGPDLAAYIAREALVILPEHVIRTLEPELNRIFTSAGQASPLTAGFLVLLVSITGAVEALRDGLNRAYGCMEDRHLVRRYLSSLFFVLVGMAFLLTVAALGIAAPLAIEFVDRYVPGPTFQLHWLETFREALLVVITAAMLFAFHLLLPARRRRVRSVIGGVLLTLFAWWLAAKVFGLYITEIANYTTTYAGLAGLIILMFFLYIQSLIFLYGAEVNRSISDLRGSALCRKEE